MEFIWNSLEKILKTANWIWLISHVQWVRENRACSQFFFSIVGCVCGSSCWVSWGDFQRVDRLQSGPQRPRTLRGGPLRRTRVLFTHRAQDSEVSVTGGCRWGGELHNDEEELCLEWTFAVVYAVNYSVNLELPTIGHINDILAFSEGKWNFSCFVWGFFFFRNKRLLRFWFHFQNECWDA